MFEQENFNPDGSTASFQDEIRNYQRQSDGFNTNIGFEYFFDDTSSITNSLVIRNRSGESETDIDFSNFDAARNPTIQRNRFTNQIGDDETVQYAVNFIKRFKRDGHELTMDYQYSKGEELENSIINEVVPVSYTHLTLPTS